MEPVRIEGSLLEELYLAHASDAVWLAYLLTGDRALAEDLVQDAFVRVAGRLLHLRDAGAFPGYLRRCVVNLARSNGRRRAVERRFVERSADPAAHVARDPDAAEREARRAALLQIPLRNRTAIVLRYYEDLSEAQIAEVMRATPAWSPDGTRIAFLRPVDGGRELWLIDANGANEHRMPGAPLVFGNSAVPWNVTA